MTNKELNDLAELIANKVIKQLKEEQKKLDDEYFKQFESEYNNINYTYIYKEKESLEDELHILENILKVHIDNEDYKSAALINKRIKEIKNKLNK
jgi:hypothetical protein